jgi:hypothetical protein
MSSSKLKRIKLAKQCEKAESELAKLNKLAGDLLEEKKQKIANSCFKPTERAHNPWKVLLPLAVKIAGIISLVRFPHRFMHYPLGLKNEKRLKAMKNILFFIAAMFFLISILSQCETSKDPISSEREPDYIFQNRVKEYHYIKNQFFLVDFYYQSVFESSFDPLTMRWLIQDLGKRIVQLDVWINDHPSGASSVFGWAVFDPTQVDPDSINFLQSIPGQNIPGFFRRLEYEEYDYDEFRGYFWFKSPIDEDDIIAIAYKNSSGEKFGMLFQEISSQNPVALLKLIKASNMIPNYPTWPLLMQNVYDMGIDQLYGEKFDVTAIYTRTGKEILVQPVGDQRTFNYLIGLDRLNESAKHIVGGDGITDRFNSLIFDIYNGYILFPSLRPFDPSFCTQFKFDNSLAVEIYNTKSETEILNQHKFDIEITIQDTVSHNKNQPYSLATY